MKTKPILFNTEIVRAILEGRKTVTRRVVKPQPTFFYKYGGEIQDPDNPDKIAFLAMTEQNGEDHEEIYVPPYNPGDILYVRETWTTLLGSYLYKANQKPGMKNPGKWRPSIHMPREAARIFLRVTKVRVERLQDIDDNGVASEGLEIGAPFDELWDSTIKKADRALYGWEANPWVWVIEFERISKEEAHAHQT